MKKKVQTTSCKLQVGKIFLICGFTSIVFCLSLVTYSLALAAEKLELSLSEAINISLKENLSLTEEQINSKISEADITVKEGEFDPSINVSLSDSYQKSSSSSELTGTEERSLSSDMSLGGKINTGTSYELAWTNERIKSNSQYLSVNPYYSSELVLSMSQPILKGFGKEMQESNLNAARNNFEISKMNVNEKAMGIISETTKAYWDLAFARNDLDVTELSLKLANNLLNEITAKIEIGILAPVEIYKAEAEVSLREEALIKAKKLIMDAADKLRFVMNLKDWQVELIPVEKTPLPSEIQSVESAVDAALKNRNDYKQALIESKNKEIYRKYYDNQRYPDLNITGAVGLNGLDGTYNTALDKLSSYDYYSWQFGLSIAMPIGNRSAKGNYLKAKYDEEKAQIALKILEQKINSEVREAWRAVQLAAETIKATKKSKTATEKRLEAEEGRFKAGMATVNDVLKFQEEYAKALSSEKRAEIDYAKAVVELDRVKGTLGKN